MSAKHAAVVSPPLVELSDTNHAGQVSVVALSFLMISIMAVGAKGLVTSIRKVWIAQIDLGIIVSLVLAFVQTALVQCAVNHGLGQHISALSRDQTQRYDKYNYAATLVAIPAVSCSKFALTALMARITPERTMRLRCTICMTVIAVWLTFAMLATALQCDTPRWRFRGDRCARRGSLIYPIIAIDILSDVLIIMISQRLVWATFMHRERRLQVASAFASRASVIVANIVRLAYVPEYASSEDASWSGVNYVICTQVAMNMAVITACIPGLYHVLSTMTSGLIELKQHTQQIEMSYLQSGSDPSRDGYLTGSLGSHLMSSAQRQSQQIGVSRTIEQTVERVGRPDEFAGEPYTHSLMLKPRIAVEESGVEAKPRDPSRW